MSLLARRVARLARTRSLGLGAAAVRRQTSLRRAEARLERAARHGEPILAGPFLGEVGYELLYWIPFLRRRLAELDIPRERVTILSRGGAGSWYADFAAGEFDALDLMEPKEFAQCLRGRRARARDAKQLDVDAFDLELAAAALERLGPAHVLHPRLMYARLRFLWERLLPLQDAADLVQYAPLTIPDRVHADRIAVKLYFSDSFPACGETSAFASRLVERLVRETEVVVLAMDEPLDDHAEWRPPGVVVPNLEPRRNLAEQTRIVAGSRALVSTYGGFSYLGPFVGTPTLALSAAPADNSFHLDLMRLANPGVDYEVAEIGDGERIERFLERTLARART